MSWHHCYCTCPSCGRYGELLVSSLKAGGQLCLHCNECLLYTTEPELLKMSGALDSGVYVAAPESVRAMRVGSMGMFTRPSETEIDRGDWRRYCRGTTYEPYDYDTLDDPDGESAKRQGPHDPYYPSG